MYLIQKPFATIPERNLGGSVVLKLCGKQFCVDEFRLYVDFKCEKKNFKIFILSAVQCYLLS